MFTSSGIQKRYEKRFFGRHSSAWTERCMLPPHLLHSFFILYCMIVTYQVKLAFSSPWLLCLLICISEMKDYKAVGKEIIVPDMHTRKKMMFDKAS